MDDRDSPRIEPTRDTPNGDHWEMFADAMDLTIEGHRLIAQEIGYEARMLWRGTVSWLRDMIWARPRHGSSPRA